MRNIRKECQVLITKIQSEQFEVLDCMSDRFDTDVETPGKGAVLVCDQYGHHCKDYFLIDYQLAQKYRGERQIPLLMIWQKELNFWEVFSKEG